MLTGGMRRIRVLRTLSRWIPVLRFPRLKAGVSLTGMTDANVNRAIFKLSHYRVEDISK
jgi:hypothetical protein